ncbi:MAG: BamA/TamA family outer membrane protein [Bacteroidales bacterium]|nr:BamA/TamA family outer membrane protein [Bacteroidales bacterium]
MKRFAYTISILSLLAVSFSCSTTKVLQDGEYRLAKNKIEVSNDKKFAISQIEPYLKQKPNSYIVLGWNPFLNVYNWQNGKGKGWDKFIQKIGVAPVVYDPDMVESSITNVKNRLEYLGYYGSKVSSKVEVHKKKVTVKYDIELGKRFVISDISYSTPGGEFGSDYFADTSSVTIRKGDYLSEAALEKETARSSEYLRNKGYYSFNKNYFFFEADTTSVRDSALLELTINEYTRNETEKDAVPFRKFKVNNVDVTYPKSLKVRESAIRNLNTIIPGDIYSETNINNTYSRLSALRIFSSINIEMNQVDTNLVDCSIKLAQTRLQGFKVNLETSVNSTGLMGVSPQVSYYHKNIFHGGEWLSLSFMGNFQFKFNDPARSTEFGVSGGLSFPKFLGLPYRIFNGPSIPRTDVNLSYNYQNRPEYTRNIISVSYGYSGSYRGRLFYQAYPVQLSVIHLFNLDNAFSESLSNDPFMKNAYQNHFDLGLGTSLYYTTNTDVSPKTSFFYTRLQFDLSGNLLSAFKPLMHKDGDGAGIIWNTPYSQYVRTELTVGKTWRFGRNNGQAIATRVVGGVGYAYGNSTALPFEKHFYVGGASSLRGWQARSVGPGTSPKDSSFVIPNQTGDIRLEANLEYRFKMFWKIDGAAFVDAGNVWTFRESADTESSRSSLLTASNFGKSIAMNWGAGIRLDLDFLVVRVDMGIKLHDPSREQRWVHPSQWFKRDGFAIHFGVGYPF